MHAVAVCVKLSTRNRVPTQDAPPITPGQLTSALRAARSLHEGSILNSRITEQFDTTVSHLRFLEVGYSTDATPDLPNGLVLKWPAEHSPAPGRGDPERLFYQELASALSSPPMVRCFAAAPPDNNPQWLILEDLRSTHSTPPWPERPSDKHVYDAVAILAQLHARWWEASTLGSMVGSLNTEASLTTMVSGIAANLPGFIKDLGNDLPVADRLVLETVFSSSFQPWLRIVDRRALTVIHGDAHTWNFLFPRFDHGPTYIFDWQLWHLDVGARDLAFMIALHWEPAVRRQLELPLLRFYYEKLKSVADINNYSFEDLFLDYRRCVVRNLTIPIILWSRGLSREAWRHRLDCALAAYREINGAELL